jgi:hypothetical protein
MWSDFGNDPIEDGEVCPNCGSVFEERLNTSHEDFEESDPRPCCATGQLEELDDVLECSACSFVNAG